MIHLEDCLNNEEVYVVLLISESVRSRSLHMGGAKCDHHVDYE